MSNINPKHSEEQRAKWREEARQRRDRRTEDQHRQYRARQNTYQMAWMSRNRERVNANERRRYHRLKDGL